MKKLTTGIGSEKLKDGFYWVYCAVLKRVIFAAFNGGRFYIHDHHHPYELLIPRVTHYKKVPEPKAPTL